MKTIKEISPEHLEDVVKYLGPRIGTVFLRKVKENPDGPGTVDYLTQLGLQACKEIWNEDEQNKTKIKSENRPTSLNN